MSNVPLDRRLLLWAPLAIAASAGLGFYALLGRMREGTYDPRGVPSPLIGKRIPTFDLPGDNGPGFSSADVMAAGTPVLINFFASWCIPCVEEAPLLDQLHKQGVAVWGIAYKDKAAATAAYLARNGNPYARLARDDPGQTAIDFGVYGVPETFFVDTDGIIRARWPGALTDDIIAHGLKPLLKTYS
ncbi:MAG TPA: DsbE family thiol:disulfide interchange protein [Acidisphaera sp.]|nr:DsbE family thiol:disulfide interchange protein [Acidisphaera sp.]